MMTFIQKFGLVVAFIFNKFFMLLLAVVILAGIPLIAISSFVTSRDAIKQALVDSNAYNSVVDNALDIVAFPTNQDIGEMPTDSEMAVPGVPDTENNKATQDDTKSVRAILDENQLIDADQLLALIKNQLGAEYIQGHAENFIDSTYNYLDGSTQNFEVTFTVSDRAPQLAEDFREFMLASLAEAPVCTQEQALTILQDRQTDGENAVDTDGEGDFSLLELECVPPGGELEQQINDLINELQKNSVFTTTYDQHELGIDNADLVSAKVAYSGLNRVATIFWVMYVTLAAAIIMTGKTIYRGFKEVGVISTVFGVFSLITFTVVASADRIIETVRDKQEGSDPSQVDAVFNIVGPIITSILDAVGSQALLMSIIVIALGILSFVIGVFLKKHHVEHIHMVHPHHNKAINPERIEPESVRLGKVASSKLEDEKPARSKAAPSKKK